MTYHERITQLREAGAHEQATVLERRFLRGEPTGYAQGRIFVCWACSRGRFDDCSGWCGVSP